jgi:hypothetical protein
VTARFFAVDGGDISEQAFNPGIPFAVELAGGDVQAAAGEAGVSRPFAIIAAAALPSVAAGGLAEEGRHEGLGPPLIITRATAQQRETRLHHRARSTSEGRRAAKTRRGKGRKTIFVGTSLRAKSFSAVLRVVAWAVQFLVAIMRGAPWLSGRPGAPREAARPRWVARVGPGA